MSSSEGELVYTMGQVNREAVGILSAVSEMSRLTLPGDPAPPTAVRLTQDRPPREQRRRRARYEGLPLHASQPAVPDVTIPLQPLPPRPPGMFYAPGYPTGPFQMYWWPPQPGFQASQYPPWSTGTPMSQGGFPSQSYDFYPGASSSQPFGFSPARTSTPQMAGLDSFTQDYRPQMDAPMFVSHQSFSTSFMQSPHSGPMGEISTQDIQAAMGDGANDSDDDDDDDDDGIPRRNTPRGGRYTCTLSPFEHDMRRCRHYHERRE